MFPPPPPPLSHAALLNLRFGNFYATFPLWREERRKNKFRLGYAVNINYLEGFSFGKRKEVGFVKLLYFMSANLLSCKECKYWFVAQYLWNPVEGGEGFPKVLVAGCHSFCLFSYIHSFTFI
jgi:hypothetical protein